VWLIFIDLICLLGLAPECTLQLLVDEDTHHREGSEILGGITKSLVDQVMNTMLSRWDTVNYMLTTIAWSTHLMQVMFNLVTGMASFTHAANHVRAMPSLMGVFKPHVRGILAPMDTVYHVRSILSLLDMSRSEIEQFFVSWAWPTT